MPGHPQGGTPSFPAPAAGVQYEWSVSVIDAKSRLLLPSFPSRVIDPTDPRVFRFGCGATGKAFEDAAVIVATGAAVSNADYGLSPDQQAHFSGYRSVAATPILFRGTRPVGVLSAIGRPTPP